jgi:hypothetical protein
MRYLLNGILYATKGAASRSRFVIELGVVPDIINKMSYGDAEVETLAQDIVRHLAKGEAWSVGFLMSHGILNEAFSLLFNTTELTKLKAMKMLRFIAMMKLDYAIQICSAP